MADGGSNHGNVESGNQGTQGDLGNSAQTLVPEGVTSPLTPLNPLPEVMTQSDDGTLRRENGCQDNVMGLLNQGHSR